MFAVNGWFIHGWSHIVILFPIIQKYNSTERVALFTYIHTHTYIPCLVSKNVTMTYISFEFLNLSLFSLQMAAEPSPFIGQSPLVSSGKTRAPTRPKRTFTGKLKTSLPNGYTKSKALTKRIKSQMQDVELLSERNAKHLFIERCQSLPGYDCTFFSVRVPQGTRFKKDAKQMLGISGKKVVFLDEKTKVCFNFLEM